MSKGLERFKDIVRRSYQFTESETQGSTGRHPFNDRNIHSALFETSKGLFDDGHFAQATFEAFKYLERTMEKLSNSAASGFKLMMEALSDENPIIRLNQAATTSEKDEQKGYRFIFAGSILAIRNPRGHEYSIKDGPDICLDHLSLVSMLLRRLESAGYHI